MLVTQRLDARYDWLPSPHNLIHKGAHYRVAYYGNACHFKSDWEEENRDGVSDETHEDQKTKAQGGHIALVSPGGDCSYFTKVMKMRNFEKVFRKLKRQKDERDRHLNKIPRRSLRARKSIV